MSDDSLENIYAYAEKAYIRMQAGDVLFRCLEEANLDPMQQMVEGLVLSGPEKLEMLREILSETNQRKVQVGDDLQQVINGLKTNLEGYGVRLRNLKNPGVISKMKPVRFLNILKTQGINDQEAQTRCLQLLKDARELVNSLEEHYTLLADIERYLDDWMWGMFYQSIHRSQGNAGFFENQM
jgi:hypothetical protein